MPTGLINNYKRTLLALAFGLPWAGLASAQSELLSPADATPTESPSGLSVNHSSAPQALTDGTLADSVNIELLYSPAGNGLQLRAGAWKIQSDLAAAATPGTLFIDDSAAPMDKRFVDRPFGPSLPQGIDLSASYVWESPRFGQFILSTKASYMYDFNREDVVDGSTPLTTTGSPLLGSDLQSSLTLTWQVGKHRASAVTHYADQVEVLGTLDMDELNKLVGNLTTVDLQYGYTLKAGEDGEAVISVGVRSVLDDQSARFLPKPAGAQGNGRMAYGTIKYQF